MIKGLFLTLGEHEKPALHLLCAQSLAALNDKLAVASSDRGRQQAYRLAFGTGVDYAIPCWIPEALWSIVDHYDGPEREATRALASRVLLRFRNIDDNDGDGNAHQQPAPPVAPAPSGALFADLGIRA